MAVAESQRSLFEEQQREFARVSGAISKAILGFLRARVNNGMPEFYAEELRMWVRQAVPTAPASADRILRALRRSGQIGYYVINRPKSLYRATFVS